MVKRKKTCRKVAWSSLSVRPQGLVSRHLTFLYLFLQCCCYQWGVLGEICKCGCRSSSRPLGDSGPRWRDESVTATLGNSLPMHLTWPAFFGKGVRIVLGIARVTCGVDSEDCVDRTLPSQSTSLLLSAATLNSTRHTADCWGPLNCMAESAVHANGGNEAGPAHCVSYSHRICNVLFTPMFCRWSVIRDIGIFVDICYLQAGVRRLPLSGPIWWSCGCVWAFIIKGVTSKDSTSRKFQNSLDNMEPENSKLKKNIINLPPHYPHWVPLSSIACSFSCGLCARSWSTEYWKWWALRHDEPKQPNKRAVVHGWSVSMAELWWLIHWIITVLFSSWN